MIILFIAAGFMDVEGLAPREVPTKGAVCQAARSTLDAAGKKILAEKLPAAVAAKEWDKKAEPQRYARIANRFGFGAAEKKVLFANGFVLTRQEYHSYVDAYHEIFTSQLPIYVSIDSVMHAVFASHESVMNRFEKEKLEPRVKQLIAKMNEALQKAGLPEPTRGDAAFYLAVAQDLLEGKKTAQTAPYLEAKGTREVEMFGRKRMVDFSAFQPRGRYSSGPKDYFRGLVWLSRIELNLVSRGNRSSTLTRDRSETPREVTLALALVNLARNAHVLDEINELDALWGELAGVREDMSFAELDALHVDSQPALAKAVAGKYLRKTPLQIMPDGVADLPVIFAMFGQRTTPDVSALPKVPGRITVTASDVGAVLGHERAKAHLKDELAAYPTLGAQLDQATKDLDAKLSGTDLYSHWLRAIRSLAKKETGTLPSFTKTNAFEDMRLASSITAFGQLRHAYALMAGNPYLGSGCEIPDGWVEPALETYDHLIAYAERGRKLVEPEYFDRLAQTLKILRQIVRTELAGAPLSKSQKEWLSMVVEIVLTDASGAPPSYAGWYFDLFADFKDATTQAKFVSDYATNVSHAFYIGANAPRIGAFVIDVGGKPRMAVGPIARPFETEEPLANGRLTEDSPPTAARSPWQAPYSAKPVPTPKFALSHDGDFLTVTAKSDLGMVTIERLDHHWVPLASETKRVKVGETRFKVPQLETLHIRIGDYHAWIELSEASGYSLSTEEEEPL